MSTMECFSVKKEHECEVVDFLKKHFFPNAALNRGLGTADLKEHPHHDLCRRIIASDASLGLRDAQTKALIGVILNEILERGNKQDMFDPENEKDPNALIGVILNEILERGYKQEMFDPENEKDPNVRKLNFIMSKLMASYDLFSDPSVTRVMDMVILCTDQMFARRGCATQLVKLSETKASELNCQMITAQATSCYSQIIFKKLGYTVQSSLDYKGFLLDGQPVLDISKMEPHTCAQVVSKYI